MNYQEFRDKDSVKVIYYVHNKYINANARPYTMTIDSYDIDENTKDQEIEDLITEQVEEDFISNSEFEIKINS